MSRFGESQLLMTEAEVREFVDEEYPEMSEGDKNTLIMVLAQKRGIQLTEGGAIDRAMKMLEGLNQ